VSRDVQIAPAPPRETRIPPKTLDHLRRRGQIWDDGDGSEQVVDIDRPATEVRRSEAVEALLADDSPPLPARPDDMPRSWSNDRINDWLGLTDGARTVVREREAERDVEVHRRQNEVGEIRRQAAEHLRAVEQAHAAEAQKIQQVRQQYELAIHASLAALEPEWSQFSAVKTAEDLKRLEIENPAAAHRFVELGNRIHSLQQQGMAVVQQRQREAQVAWQQANAGRAQQHQQYVAQQREAHEKWAREQDEAVAKSVPELRDPDSERVAEFRGKVSRHLTEALGFTQEEIAHNYEHGPLRDRRVQRMVLNSFKWEQAQARARSAMPEVRSPLKPGHSNGSFAPTNLSTIAESGNMAEFIRARSKGRVR
jgi:hypothetical protein